MDPTGQAEPGTEASPQDPEAFWAQVLSGDPARIRAAITALSEDERASVVEHLRRMATEPGWHPAQRQRARTALAAFEQTPPPEDE
jgi:hypothetical protein